MSRPPLTMTDVQHAVGLAAGESELAFTGVSTDTRTLQHGSLFVALRGERFDGHDYLAKAFALGAAAALVDHQPHAVSGPCLVVPDTLSAYGQVARAWRAGFSIPVIAVTGSVGKTTMKEMIALALSSIGSILKSERNENNEVGVPLTLLRMRDTHSAVVIEMGMRGAGQIRYLAETAQPTIGIVTVIGESHIELLGSREKIADAKGELLEALPESGTAVLNRDDPFFMQLRRKVQCPLITYGTGSSADVCVNSSARTPDGWQLVLSVFGQTLNLMLDSPARHDIVNALGAIGCAVASGATPDDVVGALSRYKPSRMRMEQVLSSSGAVLLSDCYNAAPTSVVSALLTLAELPATGRRLAFLGDMRELGAESGQMHEQVARSAAALGIDEIYPVGDQMSSAFARAARSFGTSDEAAHYAGETLSIEAGDIVLIKGSRAMTMEKIVEALTKT